MWPLDPYFVPFGPCWPSLGPPKRAWAHTTPSTPLTIPKRAWAQSKSGTSPAVQTPHPIFGIIDNSLIVPISTLSCDKPLIIAEHCQAILL